MVEVFMVTLRVQYIQWVQWAHMEIKYTFMYDCVAQCPDLLRP